MRRALGALCIAGLTLACGAGPAAAARPQRQTGMLRVTKHVVAQPGVADSGRFDLRAAGPAVTVATNVGDGGTTGFVTVPTGSYVVSETAHQGTNLGDYNASIACRDTAAGHTGSASANGSSLTIVVGSGDAWDCTVTNARKYAGIALEKDGPASAMAGTTVTYTLTVSNVGTVPFPAARVIVADPQCATPPALQSANGDPTPATLDPGDRWTYACQVVTGLFQTRVDNAGTVNATDLAGRTASATAQVSTVLTPGADEQPASNVQIAPVAIQSGRATLYGPRGCPVRATTAFVKGRRIARVTYYVDGRRVRTLTHANRAGHWTLRLTLRGLRTGPHRLSATIQFTGDSNTRTQTLRLSFVRCRGGAVAPSFTG
jgi:hypothetical protein